MLLGVDPASAFLAFVSNEKGNSISVVDTDKMETVATIPTGQRPRGIAVSKDGKSVFVALGDDDTIQIFDTKTYQNIGELPSGPDPEQFALDPAGKRLYVANENDAMVTIIDVDKRLALGQISVGVEPEGMSVSPDSSILVCTSETTSMAHFIDTKSHEIVANVLLGSRPRFSAYKSDGSELWVTSEVGGELTIIDPATRKIKTIVRFEVPGLRAEEIQPVGINLTKDGKLGIHRSGARQSGRRRRWRDPQGRKIPARWTTRLARRFHAGRKISGRRQRRFERCFRDRRRKAESHQVDPGRRTALGRRVCAELIARTGSSASGAAPNRGGGAELVLSSS